jgi:predicted nucleic acid-binding protein
LAFGSRNATELANVRSFLSQFTVLWLAEYDAPLASDYARLKLSHGTGILDALTAALAVSHGLALATLNVRHFEPFPDLITVRPYSK